MRKMIGSLPIIFRIQILGIILPSQHHSRAHRHSAFSFSDFLLAQQALRLNRTSQVCVGRHQSYEHRRASLILSATFSRAWLVTGDWPLANPISPSWMWVKFVKPASSRVLALPGFPWVADLLMSFPEGTNEGYGPIFSDSRADRALVC